MKNPKSRAAVKYHDGASVSTALDVGLASLPMYYVRLAVYKTKAEPA